MHSPRVIAAIASLSAALCLAGCSGSHSAPPADGSGVAMASSYEAMGSHFHYRPAASSRGAWVVLLPGASGLKIFEDESHYYRAAEALNAEGFDAVVVDYKAAYKAARNAPNLPTGGKIAWVAEQAVAWARTTGKIKADAPGAIVAWSLGAEGLWPLLADDVRVKALRLTATAAYYPSNEDDTPLKTTIPFLILTGEKDDVTEAKSIRAMVSRAASPVVMLKVYPGVNHGFDVASIREPRTVRLLPLIGPSATFGYDEAASRSAAQELSVFLREHVR